MNTQSATMAAQAQNAAVSQMANSAMASATQAISAQQQFIVNSFPWTNPDQ